jgi:hypothetical protein
MTCSAVGCNKQADAPNSFGGQRYCEEHYRDQIDLALRAAFEAWPIDTDPPREFRNMLGRASEEQQWTNEGCMSKARIRDRAYGFVKTEQGCTFQITRHPYAHVNGFVTDREVQTWEANLALKTIVLLDTREWRIGDPDPNFL